MATIVPYTPSQLSPFTFQATLDGSIYNCIVNYNLAGGPNRPYLNIFDLNNTLIVTKAMVASPSGYDINLVWGYFTTSTLVFRESSQQIEIGP